MTLVQQAKQLLKNMPTDVEWRRPSFGRHCPGDGFTVVGTLHAPDDGDLIERCTYSDALFIYKALAYFIVKAPKLMAKLVEKIEKLQRLSEKGP